MTTVHTDDLDLLERLGGSRATVHRAVVRTTGRVVIAKHAPWDRPDVVAGLGREAEALGRTTHPAVVRLLHTIEDDTGRTLVLAHAPGGSLGDRLADHGPLPPAEVADLGARIAEGLAALHRQGIVHRDVHPGNVVIDAELQPLLVDLDHALDDGAEHLPLDDEVVGHPDHVDPRLFSGGRPGPASDLHALATTLWTLATGTPPVRSSPRERVDLGPDGRVPPALHAALLACLGATDAGAVATALRTTALELAAEPPSPLPPSPGADLPPPEPQPAPSPIPGPLPTPEVQRPLRLAPPPAAAAHRPGPTPRPGLVASNGTSTGGGGATRRWGTAPRPAPLTTIVAHRGVHWLVAAVAVVVVAVAPAALWLTRADDTPTTTVTAPAPCDDVDVDGPAGHVLADLDGDGCSEPMTLTDGVLTTTTGSYRLGQPGDVLVAGDWDGDGVWTPGLYRPPTGEAFLFDTAPGDTTVTSRPVLELPAGGRPAVVDADGDGHHELVVTPDA